MYLLRHNIPLEVIKDMEADDADMNSVNFVFRALYEFDKRQRANQELQIAQAVYMACGGIHGGKKGFNEYKKYIKSLERVIEHFNTKEKVPTVSYEDTIKAFNEIGAIL